MEGASKQSAYNTLLLVVAGLGGLLYGVDVGIISGALPYLESTSGLSRNQLSFVVAAVLLGSVLSTLFAGLLADALGRKRLMFFSGLIFVVSIPVIALSQGYAPLILGRLLQGVSAGLIGVVAPLYLAECLDASNRGKGAGIFQWLLTLGLVLAALIAMLYSAQLEKVEILGKAQELFAAKDRAWRNIFWVSLAPGILFVIGSLMVAESPRWLFRRGRRDAARAALLRSRTEEQADSELKEMEETAASEKTKAASSQEVIRESLLARKYVLPFMLACTILACNQATGVNSIIGYNATILIQAGLNDKQAHLGYVILTLVNFVTTIGAVLLVDRKGRKFLLSLGSGGVIVCLIGAGLLFRNNEKDGMDVTRSLQAMVLQSGQTAGIPFTRETATRLLMAQNAGVSASGRTLSLEVIYSYGSFHASSKVVRTDEPSATIDLSRDQCVPATAVSAFFENPFADLEEARGAPLRIDHALIMPVPSTGHGWLTAAFIYCFMAFFAIGPGVCVWLALSELMPTRIRSNGMSIALLINQAVSTAIAAVFLPVVGRYGYSTVFFVFAGCTVIYFVTAAFLLPETKGKTLEEIEAHFERRERTQRSVGDSGVRSESSKSRSIHNRW